jgi:hypothetical protein
MILELADGDGGRKSALKQIEFKPQPTSYKSSS